MQKILLNILKKRHNMRNQELQALLEAKHRQLTETYPKMVIKLITEVYDTGYNFGVEVGKRICTDTLRMIPVEERLPLRDRRVLCQMKSNGQIVSGYLYKKDGKVCVATDPNFEFEDYCDYEATHWFPLFDVIGIKE